MLYVRVDRNKCCGYAMCAEVAPDVYELDDSGYANVRMEIVPGELADQARRGAGACPQRAITVDEVTATQSEETSP